MNEAINRIAICAEKKQYQSLILLYVSQGNNITSLEECTKEEIASITPKNKPRLSKIEIDEIVKDYPFKLPVEIYDLYQRGNGYGLPIGLDRNYDTYTNYFMFPLSGNVWDNLERAINIYKSIKDSNELDNKLFPLFSSELCLYTVEGSKEQKETSPLFYMYHDDIPTVPRLGASSLTGVMLACAERMEKGYGNASTEYLMSKYDIYNDLLIYELS